MAIIVCEVPVEMLDVGHVVGCKKPLRVGNPEGFAGVNWRVMQANQGAGRNSAVMVRTAMASEDGMGWDGVALPS